MHELTAMIRADLKPALGVTEPGAVAFCAALAKSNLPGDLIHLDVRMNSGMYKNALTAAFPIPGGWERDMRQRWDSVPGNLKKAWKPSAM